MEKDVSTPQNLVRPWLIPAATTLPLCTIGPSFPTGNPAATLNVTPTTLHTRVLSLTILGRSIPFRKHFTSGMPDPPLTGST